MDKNTDFCIVYCTTPDQGTARHLANLVVENSLAACVSILPGITSVYQWQGKTESATEELLMIKTCNHQFDALSNYLRKHHPYELPEIIAVPIANGLQDYLNWIDQSVTPSK